MAKDNSPLNKAQHALVAAQGLVDQMEPFKTQLDNDKTRQLQRKWAADPSSGYIKAIAKKLKKSPDEVIDELETIAFKIRKWMQVATEVQHFKYHCPYCGGIESPTCAYMGESLDWKIEHSLIKPWTETVIETKLVETTETVRKPESTSWLSFSAWW